MYQNGVPHMGYTDRLDEETTPAWVSKPEDKLFFRLTGRYEYTSKFGQEVTVLEGTVAEHEVGISTLEGEPIEPGEDYCVHCFGTVLANEVAKANPQISDLIGIKNRGLSTKTPKAGQSPPALYRVVVFERGGYRQALDAEPAAGTEPPPPATAVQPPVPMPVTASDPGF